MKRFPSAVLAALFVAAACSPTQNDTPSSSVETQPAPATSTSSTAPTTPVTAPDTTVVDDEVGATRAPAAVAAALAAGPVIEAAVVADIAYISGADTPNWEAVTAAHEAALAAADAAPSPAGDPSPEHRFVGLVYAYLDALAALPAAADEGRASYDAAVDEANAILFGLGADDGHNLDDVFEFDMRAYYEFASENSTDPMAVLYYETFNVTPGLR